MSLVTSCQFFSSQTKSKIASEILGNPKYPAIAYGGYRNSNRADAPSVEHIQEDVKILHAAGFRVLRTYHARLYNHTANLLQAIEELKAEDSNFEMYVMLGIWIQCEDAWTDNPIHSRGDSVNNNAEFNKATELANTYPDIVKVIAVGNESMVHWANGYFVQPHIILQWVNNLQNLKKTEKLPTDLWITSSDNYASWGGATPEYHSEDLNALINAVDYLSIHTYPFHDTHYNPAFWPITAEEERLNKEERIAVSMNRSLLYAQNQYQSVFNYMIGIGANKPIHIGETGWSTISNGFYGTSGSRASDEYKQQLYYSGMRHWSDSLKISCFFFEAFDEPWKGGNNANGSENHFGLFTVDGQAKYSIWNVVDKKVFEGLGRNGITIKKSFHGDTSLLMERVFSPPAERNMKVSELKMINSERELGVEVDEDTYVIWSSQQKELVQQGATYPSATLKLNVWDSTCSIEGDSEKIITVNTGGGDWWGCALEFQANGKGENMSVFKSGMLHFEIKGTTQAAFEIGFQTGVYSKGTQANNGLIFGESKEYSLTEEWKSYSIPISKLNKGADLTNVTSVLYLLSGSGCDGKLIEIKNIIYTKN